MVKIIFIADRNIPATIPLQQELSFSAGGNAKRQSFWKTVWRFLVQYTLTKRLSNPTHSWVFTVARGGELSTKGNVEGDGTVMQRTDTVGT